MNNLAKFENFLNLPETQAVIEKIKNKNKTIFVDNLLQIVKQNQMLAGVDPDSIFNAALMATNLNLPFNSNLGFAYILPYGNQAQFQIGYKGLIQLALNSGQFERIVVEKIYKNTLIKKDPINGFVFSWDYEPKSPNERPVGYYSFFKLQNGFTAELYMTAEEIHAHAQKYSKSYQRGAGVWASNFDAMAKKTVLKLLLSRFAPLSVDSIQTAIKADQAVINSIDGDFRYIDNENERTNKAVRVMRRANEVLRKCADADAVAIKTRELCGLMPDFEAEIMKISEKVANDFCFAENENQQMANSHNDD